jgi:hypothetical protein
MTSPSGPAKCKPAPAVPQVTCLQTDGACTPSEQDPEMAPVFSVLKRAIAATDRPLAAVTPPSSQRHRCAQMTDISSLDSCRSLAALDLSDCDQLDDISTRSNCMVPTTLYA